MIRQSENISPGNVSFLRVESTHTTPLLDELWNQFFSVKTHTDIFFESQFYPKFDILALKRIFVVYKAPLRRNPSNDYCYFCMEIT